jgi:hypothetical protein
MAGAIALRRLIIARSPRVMPRRKPECFDLGQQIFNVGFAQPRGFFKGQRDNEAELRTVHGSK